MSAKSRLLQAAAAALYATGAMPTVSRLAGRVRGAGTFQILTYHRVNDDRDPFFPSLPTSVFERQAAYIARTSTVLTVEALVDRARRGRLPSNAVALTFDDGYRDNLTHAAPILARLGLPATIFLATGVIGTGRFLWFDWLALAIRDSDAASVHTPWGVTLSLANTEARLAALDACLARLKRLPATEFERHLDTLLQLLGGGEVSRLKNVMLDWDAVHALSGLGVSIGAHTVSHPILSRLAPEKAEREIIESRSRITEMTGVPPRVFAYPNGAAEDYTPTVTRLVREAGFGCAVTTRYGLNTHATPPYELRRGGPWERDLPTFALKLAASRLLRGEAAR